MYKISKAQYAVETREFIFLLYESQETAIATLLGEDDHSARLRSWLTQGNTVEEFVPVISGGIVPAGAIMWFASQRLAEGYLLCDGSAVSRTQYARLFEALGTIYGSGDGGTTFNLPNLVGRFIRGWGPVSPFDPTRTFGSYQEDGVGSHTHGLLPIEHNHTITDPGHLHGVTDPGHIHPTVENGHIHSVNDPGHIHPAVEFSQTGYSDAYSRSNIGLIRIPPAGFFYRKIDYVITTAKDYASVTVSGANVVISPAQANVVAGAAVTNVTINVANTNIPYTDVETDPVGFETRPVNMALLPMIRY